MRSMVAYIWRSRSGPGRGFTGPDLSPGAPEGQSRYFISLLRGRPRELVRRDLAVGRRERQLGHLPRLDGHVLVPQLQVGRAVLGLSDEPVLAGRQVAELVPLAQPERTREVHGLRGIVIAGQRDADLDQAVPRVHAGPLERARDLALGRLLCLALAGAIRRRGRGPPVREHAGADQPLARGAEVV